MSGSGSVLHPSQGFLGTGLSPLFRSGVASSFERVQLVGGHDSWDSLPGPVSLRSVGRAPGGLPLAAGPPLLFDLRAGKVTRQI